MKITNRLGLPQAFVNAVSTERHTEEGVLSVTGLLKGACEQVLTERHWDEIEQDAADRVWATFGTAVHKIFEGEDDGCEHEIPVEMDADGTKIVGRVDSFDAASGVVYDWKTASVWKVKMRDFSDWRRQGMLYATMLKLSGRNVDRVRFIALLKDWSAAEAKRDGEYPQSPVYVVDFDFNRADYDEAIVFADKAADDYRDAKKRADEDLPPCTDEQRWATGEKWAVMKAGRKTAVKLFDSEEEAQKHAESLGAGHSVIHRPPTYRKCENYCIASKFCPHWKAF